MEPHAPATLAFVPPREECNGLLRNLLLLPFTVHQFCASEQVEKCIPPPTTGSYIQSTAQCEKHSKRCRPKVQTQDRGGSLPWRRLALLGTAYELREDTYCPGRSVSVVVGWYFVSRLV
jgi:hypothetical protein